MLIVAVVANASFRINGFYVSLYVRVSNAVAINFYKKLGYKIHRHIIGYYAGDDKEDGYGSLCLTDYAEFALVEMRKSLPRDIDGKFSGTISSPVHPNEAEL